MPISQDAAEGLLSIGAPGGSRRAEVLKARVEAAYVAPAKLPVQGNARAMRRQPSRSRHRVLHIASKQRGAGVDAG